MKGWGVRTREFLHRQQTPLWGAHSAPKPPPSGADFKRQGFIAPIMRRFHLSEPHEVAPPMNHGRI
jgi:hypothetical protein